MTLICLCADGEHLLEGSDILYAYLTIHTNLVVLYLRVYALSMGSEGMKLLLAVNYLVFPVLFGISLLLTLARS